MIAQATLEQKQNKQIHIEGDSYQDIATLLSSLTIRPSSLCLRVHQKCENAKGIKQLATKFAQIANNQLAELKQLNLMISTALKIGKEEDILAQQINRLPKLNKITINVHDSNKYSKFPNWTDKLKIEPLIKTNIEYSGLVLKQGEKLIKQAKVDSLAQTKFRKQEQKGEINTQILKNLSKISQWNSRQISCVTNYFDSNPFQFASLFRDISHINFLWVQKLELNCPIYTIEPICTMMAPNLTSISIYNTELVNACQIRKIQSKYLQTLDITGSSVKQAHSFSEIDSKYFSTFVSEDLYNSYSIESVSFLSKMAMTQFERSAFFMESKQRIQQPTAMSTIAKKTQQCEFWSSFQTYRSDD